MRIDYTDRTKETLYYNGIDANKLNGMTAQEILDKTVEDHIPLYAVVEETKELVLLTKQELEEKINSIPKHSHSNLNILKGFSESNGELYYKGKPVSSSDSGGGTVPGGAMSTTVLFKRGAHTLGDFYMDGSISDYSLIMLEFSIVDKGIQMSSALYRVADIKMGEFLTSSFYVDQNNYFNFTMQFVTPNHFKLVDIKNSTLWNSRSISKVIGIK